MKNLDKILEDGIIESAQGGIWFMVKLMNIPNMPIIRAYLSGKIRMNNIKIIPGDRVVVQLSEYDTTQGIIVYRNR